MHPSLQVFSALELAGSAFDTPWLRLAVAVTTAVAVHSAVSSYQESNPTQLKRQLSPAKSLSDALADQAAAAVMKAAGLDNPNKQQQKQQQREVQMERQRTRAMAGALPGAAVAAVGFPPTTTSSSSSSSSDGGFKLGSMFSAFSSAGAGGSGPALGGSVIPKALGAAGALLLLGQVRRADMLGLQVLFSRFCGRVQF